MTMRSAHALIQRVRERAHREIFLDLFVSVQLSERTREGTPAFSTRSRVKNRTRCAEKKKKKWTRRRENERPKPPTFFSKRCSFARLRAREGSSRWKRNQKDIIKFSQEVRCLFEAFLQKRHAKKVALSWRKRRKRRDFYPILRLFPGTLFFFFVVCSNSKKKKIFLEREREDLNAVIMMERT